MGEIPDFKASVVVFPLLMAAVYRDKDFVRRFVVLHFVSRHLGFVDLIVVLRVVAVGRGRLVGFTCKDHKLTLPCDLISVYFVLF